jgi:AcrR family transcriptional regulator
MGIAERKIRQKEIVRTAILDAAWKMVEKEGWQALSIRRIAEAIEYSVPVIYDHFANKEAILIEFTKRGFQQLDDRLMQVQQEVSDPEAQLEAMAYAYWDFAFENKEYYQLMYGLGIPSCETMREIKEVARFTELILYPINKIITASKKRKVDPSLKLHTFWSMLHGLISINMMDHENDRKELNHKVLKDFISSLINSIKN